MKTKRDIEAPLSPKDVAAILRVCSPQGLLVGGQALAFWGDYLQVKRPAALRSGVTSDADFIGSSALAQKLGQTLGWTTWIPSLDDVSPQTGKVTKRLANGSVKQVDFLSGVVGLTTKDIRRRAVDIEIPGAGPLRVMHPVDVLDSRIQNLHLLAQKRGPAGIAQASLAIAVVRSYIVREINHRGERAGLKLLERVVEIAGDLASVRVFLLFGLDPLLAVPLEAFRVTSALHLRRWPQLSAELDAQREALRKALARRPGARQ